MFVLVLLVDFADRLFLFEDTGDDENEHAGNSDN